MCNTRQQVTLKSKAQIVVSVLKLWPLYPRMGELEEPRRSAELAASSIKMKKRAQPQRHLWGFISKINKRAEDKMTHFRFHCVLWWTHGYSSIYHLSVYLNSLPPTSNPQPSTHRLKIKEGKRGFRGRVPAQVMWVEETQGRNLDPHAVPVCFL